MPSKKTSFTPSIIIIIEDFVDTPMANDGREVQREIILKMKPNLARLLRDKIDAQLATSSSGAVVVTALSKVKL